MRLLLPALAAALAATPTATHAATVSVNDWAELVAAVQAPTTDRIVVLHDILADASAPTEGLRVAYGRAIVLDGDVLATNSPTTDAPSRSPIIAPSQAPLVPSMSPSISPSTPTVSPTSSPGPDPFTTSAPSGTPSSQPTTSKPSRSPVLSPSHAPSDYQPLPNKTSGTSEGRRVIDMAGFARAFLVEHGASLTLSNVKIINAVAFNASELTLLGEDLLLHKRKTHADGQEAVYLDSVGGAVFNHGNLTLSNVLFANNLARAGGAIFNWGLILSIADCEFTNNTAAAVQYLGNSTDPHWIAGQTRIMHYDYARNQYWQFWSYNSHNEYGLWKAGNPGYPFLGGGAIAQPNLFRASFSESYNSNRHGLGPVARTVFNRNRALQRGGALYLSAGRALVTTFTDCRFVSNQATYHPQRATVDRYAEEMMVVHGGAIALIFQQRGGETTIRSIVRSQFENNRVVNDKGAAMGGAIAVSVSGGPGWSAVDSIDYVTPADRFNVITSMEPDAETSLCCGANTGKSNPFMGSVTEVGTYWKNNVDMRTTFQIRTISSCTFTNNVAEVEGEPESLWEYPAVPVEKSAGGAISTSGNLELITDTTFTGNKALGFSGTGGALAFTGGRWNQMGGYDLLFDNFYESFIAKVKSTTFTENVATNVGGAVQSDHGLIKELRSVTFTHNHAGDRAGGLSLGRVYTYDTEEWKTFLRDRATSWGIPIDEVAIADVDYKLADDFVLPMYYPKFENNTVNKSCAAMCLERWTPVTVLDLVAIGNKATVTTGLTGYGAVAVRDAKVTLRGPWFKYNQGIRGGALGLGNGAIVTIQHFPLTTDGEFDPETAKDPAQPTYSPTGFHKPAFIGNSGFQGGGIYAEPETSLTLSNAYFNLNVARSTCLEMRSDCKLESGDPGFGYLPQTCGDEIHPSFGYCAGGVGGDVYTLGGFTAASCDFYGASLPNIYQAGYNYTTLITPVNTEAVVEQIPFKYWSKFRNIVGRNIYTHTTARVVQCKFDAYKDVGNDPTQAPTFGGGPGGGPGDGGGGPPPGDSGGNSTMGPFSFPGPSPSPGPGRRLRQHMMFGISDQAVDQANAIVTFGVEGGGSTAAAARRRSLQFVVSQDDRKVEPLTTDWTEYAPMFPVPKDSFMQCGSYELPVCGPRAKCTSGTTSDSIKCDCDWISKQFGTGVDALDLSKGCPMCPFPYDVFVLQTNNDVPETQFLRAPSVEQLTGRADALLAQGNITFIQWFMARSSVGYVPYLTKETFSVPGIQDSVVTWTIKARQAINKITNADAGVLDSRYLGQCNATYPTCVGWPDVHPLYNITWTWPYKNTGGGPFGGGGEGASSESSSSSNDVCSTVKDSGNVPDWFIVYVSPQAGDLASVAFAAVKGRKTDTEGKYVLPFVALPMGMTWYIGVAGVNGFDPTPKFRTTKTGEFDIFQAMSDLLDLDGRQARTDTSTTYRTKALVDCPMGQVSIPHPSGLAECRDCPANQYKKDQYTCLPCPEDLPFSKAGSDSLAQCGANPGDFSYVDPVTGKVFVAKCPGRALCNGGTKVETLTLRRNHWRSVNNSRTIYQCKTPEFCWGGQHTQRWGSWGAGGYGTYASDVPPGIDTGSDVGKAANVSNTTTVLNATAAPSVGGGGSRRQLLFSMEEARRRRAAEASMMKVYVVDPIAEVVHQSIQAVWTTLVPEYSLDEAVGMGTGASRRRHLDGIGDFIGNLTGKGGSNQTNTSELFAQGDAYCRPGHVGPLCNGCVEGLAMRKGVGCDVCEPKPLSFVVGVLVGQIIGFLAVASLAAALFLLYEKHAMKQLRAAHEKVAKAQQTMNQAMAAKNKAEDMSNKANAAANSTVGKAVLGTPEGQALSAAVTEQATAQVMDSLSPTQKGLVSRAQAMSTDSITSKISMDRVFRGGEWVQQQLVKAKILLGMAQVASSFSITFGNVYPADITNVWDTISILGLNFAQFLDLGCTLGTNFYSQALVTCLTPLGFLFLLVMGNRIQTRRLKKSGKTKPEELKDVQRSLITSVTALAFLVYPTVSATIVNLFPCETFDYLGQEPNRSFLRADYSIDCNVPSRTGWLAFAWIMVLIYPVGIPVLFFTLLYRKRKILEDPNRDVNDPAVAHLKMLFYSYEPGFWYYEVFELLRKLIVTSIVVFFLDGTVTQIILTLLISILWVGGLVANKPYLKKEDDELAALAQFGLIYTLIGGITLKLDVAGQDGYSARVYSAMIYLSLIVAPVEAFYKALTDVFPFLPKGSIFQFFTPQRLVHYLFLCTSKKDRNAASKGMAETLKEQAIGAADAQTGGMVSKAKGWFFSKKDAAVKKGMEGAMVAADRAADEAGRLA